MQLLFDFLPVAAFFVAYKLADIYVATGVIIAATVLQVGSYWLWKRRVKPIHLVSAGLVLVFGGLTLGIHDTAFIMWKPTVLYWLVAAAFLLSMWRRVSDRPLVQRMFGTVGELPEVDARDWRRLNWSSVVFFATLGAANVAVFRNFDEGTWVTFKRVVFGIILAFVMAQGFWLASRADNHDEPAG